MSVIGWASHPSRTTHNQRHASRRTDAAMNSPHSLRFGGGRMPSPTAVRPIEGSERRPAPGARRVAAENPSAKLSVTIRVRRRTDAPALPVHHHADTTSGHVSREEFAERFGASKAD